MVNLFSERFVYGISALFFLFSLTNFDRNLGIVFGMMALFNLIMFESDKFPTVFIEKKRNLGKSLLLAIGGYAAFIVASLVTLPLFKQVTSAVTLNSVLDVLVETQQTLALEGYIPLQFVAFGFFVCIVETGMLGNLLELFKDRFKVNINQTNFKTISLFVALSIIFVIFHLSAKGINNFPALWMVFLFGMITFVLYRIEGQLMAAILFHIIVNSIALALKFNLVPAFGMAAVYVGIGLLAFFIITKRFDIRKLKFS